MKILPVGAELFHADKKAHRRTEGHADRNDEANNCFSQFFEGVSKLAEFPIPHMSSCHADGQVYILYPYELCHEPLFSSPRRKFELDNIYYHSLYLMHG
jgi:hypothetical protein